MIKPYYKIFIILFLFLTNCGSNQLQSSDKGSVSFKLQLSHPAAVSRAAAATSADICTDYGITNINARVVNSFNEVAASSDWSCSVHQGAIFNVPAGTDYVVRITGTITGGAKAWSGEKIGVRVTAGEVTEAGVITMDYIGNDNTLPYINSTTPANDAAGVPATSMISAKFSEKMAASSINDSAFIVKKNGVPVNGYTVYDSVIPMAIFLHSGRLDYSSIYTAAIAADVEDMAGNQMGSVYEWNFTTEDQPPPGTLTATPSGLIAASGNRQIKITWDAVPAASWYNIYWSSASGVTGDKRTKIPDITSNYYTHTGLSNGTTYFYLVTSGNNYGESAESVEIASVPGSNDTSPPTGSVTINNNADYTTSTVVELLLLSSSARGISQMCISNTNTCSSWEPYATTKSWTLTEGDGLKYVYAWFKDSTGISNVNPYFSTIILDTKLLLRPPSSL